MTLAEYRKSLGLSQEECARALGLQSKGQICSIETGKRRASLSVAMRIEVWSRGQLKAADLCATAAEIAQTKAAKRPRKAA